MAKNLGALLVLITVLLSSCAGGAGTAATVSYPNWKIGIITQPAGESYFAARELVERYGENRVVHRTFPQNFMQEQDATIAEFVAFASDQDIRAIIACSAVHGTLAGIERAREMRDDILFIGGESQDEIFAMSENADILFAIDASRRGYTIVQKAKEMGAETFVFISFPRHMSFAGLSQLREIMRGEATRLGLEFVYHDAPDPVQDSLAAAEAHILTNLPLLVERYGSNTAFYSTACGFQPPLIRAIVSTGAIFPEQCCPSPFHGLPEAFNINIPADKEGDIPFILSAIEDKVRENNMQGRISTWTAPIITSFIRAGAIYGIAYATGELQERQDLEFAKAALRQAAGNVSITMNPAMPANYLPVIGESIIFGRR